MAVTHIIPKVNTSKASVIRDHQGSDTRLNTVNLLDWSIVSNFSNKRENLTRRDLSSVRFAILLSAYQTRKTYLPDYVHRKGSDEKITMSTIVHKMFRFPEKQECRDCSDSHSDANGKFIAP